MQMLGQIHRTGQVVLPSYSLLMGNIPAGTRPGAILKLGDRALDIALP